MIDAFFFALLVLGLAVLLLCSGLLPDSPRCRRAGSLMDAAGVAAGAAGAVWFALALVWRAFW